MIQILAAIAVLVVMGLLFGVLLLLREKIFDKNGALEENGSEEAEEKTRLSAVIHCTGCGSEFSKYNYQGIRDCLSASRMPGGGPLSCDYGCLGMGTCVKACSVGAIHMDRGVAVVDRERCTGCGECEAACPRRLIALEPFKPKKHVFIPCNSRAAGEEVSEHCTNGCIGCSLCVKECPRGAVAVEGELARIDYEKCDGCGLCVKKCPRQLIQAEEVAEPPKPAPKQEKPVKPPKEVKASKKAKAKAVKEKRGLKLPEGKEQKSVLAERPAESSAVPEEETAALGSEPKEPKAEVEKIETPVVEKSEEVSKEETEAGEEKVRLSAEAFKVFEQAVAAAGEVLGEDEKASGSEDTPVAAAAEGGGKKE